MMFLLRTPHIYNGGVILLYCLGMYLAIIVCDYDSHKMTRLPNNVVTNNVSVSLTEFRITWAMGF